jgi:tetratricopeptide (TPR) repeat protein
MAMTTVPTKKIAAMATTTVPIRKIAAMATTTGPTKKTAAVAPTIVNEATAHQTPRVNGPERRQRSVKQLGGRPKKSGETSIQVSHRRSSGARIAIAALLIALLLTPSTQVRSATAPEQFQLGRQAFEAGNFLAALESFEAAAATGMSGPAVHFNIGVCAYRLGRLARAEQAFREVALSPAMSALAHYNLGLVAVAADRRTDAARWFARVEKESSDERLRALARAQLREIVPPAERNWSAYASLDVGYDDNVALISESDVLGVSGTSDTFVEALLSGSTSIAYPWRFDASIGVLDYQELDDFDQISTSASARYRRRVGSWNAETLFQGTFTTLDGDAFQHKRMVALQASRALTDNWRVRTRYRYGDLDGLGDFKGLDGRRHELDARAAWRGGPWDLAIDYRFDATEYRNQALSLHRHEMAVNVQRQLKEGWAVEAQVALDRSRYDRGNTEDRNEWELAISRELSSRWRAVVRYGHANNNADRFEFDYRRNRVSAAVEATL